MRGRPRKPAPLSGANSMFTIFGVPSAALFGQLLIGLINGSFYALLSLGLAIIFGMLNIINFAHGAQYMLGALAAYLLLQVLGLGYWPSLIVAPIIVGMLGIVIERFLLQWLVQARPSLRPAADLRARAHHRRRLPTLFRHRRPAVLAAGPSSGWPQPRFHVPAQLPRLGDCRLAHGLSRHLVRHRAYAASAPICGPPPKIRHWCAPLASTCRA